MDGKNRELKKVLKDSSRLKVDLKIDLIDIESQLNEFDDFYNSLFEIENITLIPYKNEFLPYIVDRAIKKSKPFTEEKSELKDALIWKSYSNHVENNDLDDCILLTNNTSDFCSRQDKTKVHPELLTDTDKFKVINSAFNFLKVNAKLWETPERKISAYISQLDLNTDMVLDMLYDNFQTEIERKVYERIEDINPSDLLSRDYHIDGYVSGYGIEFSECENIEYEILTDSALVSGKLYLGCHAECYNYTGARDYYEEQLSMIGEEYLLIEIYFNFDLKVGDDFSDFEFLNIKITRFDP